MCTATTYKTRDFYFGRTLDYEFSYGEEVVVMPRHFPLTFRHEDRLEHHHAIIGMAHVADGYPLYYDAANECGLCIAGLNFVGNARYGEPSADSDNVAQFELIPWILGRYGSVAEVRESLGRLKITGTPFSDMLPAAELHWIVADRNDCIVLESMADGLHVYDNPVGVLANNPPFNSQMQALANFRGLSARTPECSFAPGIELAAYSRGMGGLGLPGDLSSQSRFIRAAFTRGNSRSGEGEEESVSQLFHILGSVDQSRGCCELDDGKLEMTIYTSCINADRGIYYYTTYDGHAILGVDMHRVPLDSPSLARFPLQHGGLKIIN